jgi:serine/threonine protein kinase
MFRNTKNEDPNIIEINGEKYKKEIKCDDENLIKKLQHKGKLPSDDTKNFVIKCVNNFTYKIGNYLGEGTFNTVYELLDDNDKVIRITNDDANVEDLDREITGLFLQHYTSSSEPVCNNICKVFEFGYLKQIRTFGRSKTRVYAIIEKLPVPDLISVVYFSPTLYDFKKLMKQALYGLKCMNNKKFVHLDIKLENIGIDKDGNAKLIDFGLARYLEDDGMKGETSGTPLNIDPKFADTGEVHFNSDIYSFGSVLFDIYFNAEKAQHNDYYYHPYISEYKTEKFNILKKSLYAKTIQDDDYSNLIDLIKK